MIVQPGGKPRRQGTLNESSVLEKARLQIDSVFAIILLHESDASETCLLCRVDADAVLVIYSFPKKTKTTPKTIIDLCRKRLALYDTTK